MPGSVANAVSIGVMPFSLCTMFAASRQWSCDINEYPDGSSQRLYRTTTSRKRWEMSKRLSPAQNEVELGTFWNLCDGRTEAFYFYDLLDDKTAVYDATGTALTARYLVRFDNDWIQSVFMGGRINHDRIALVEVG